MGTSRGYRVALVSHADARVGGVESYVASVVPALVAAGHEVGCWFETRRADERSLVDGLDVTACVGTDHADRGLGRLRAFRPDLIYAQGVTSPTYEHDVMQVAPAVFFAHSYYGTCISGTKSWRVPTRQSCQRTFGPGCLAHYYPHRCGGLDPRTALRQYVLQRERLALLRRYARVLVASGHMLEEYRRHGLGASTRLVALPVDALSPERPRRLPPDAGTDVVAPPARDVAAGGLRLVFLGRFEEPKGAPLALECAALLAASTAGGVRLQMSGEGSLRAVLVERAAALMAQVHNLRVVITPWLSPMDTGAALDDADLLLVPSLWPEPFGLVGVEAALQGVPAVAFAVGGISDWLVDGQTGVLVPAEDCSAAALATGVRRAVGDPAAFARMRDACRVRARRFGREAHMAALQAVFDEVVTGTEVVA